MHHVIHRSSPTRHLAKASLALGTCFMAVAITALVWEPPASASLTAALPPAPVQQTNSPTIVVEAA